MFTGLFSSVWWAWAGFTFYANRFGTDDIVYRLAKLEAMLVSPDWPPATDATESLAGQSRFAMPPSGWYRSSSTCVPIVMWRRPAA